MELELQHGACKIPTVERFVEKRRKINTTQAVLWNWNVALCLWNTYAGKETRHKRRRIQYKLSCGIETTARRSVERFVTDTTQNTIQYNTIQYNTMQCNAMQCNTIQYNTNILVKLQHGSCKIHRWKVLLRLLFTLSGVFSFSYVTSLICIGYPQTYISMESLWNYLDDGDYIFKIIFFVNESKLHNSN